MARDEGHLAHVTFTIDHLEGLVRALRAEEDGKQLRRDLARNMREALKPAAVQAKAGIMSMSSTGQTKPALRSAIARRIRPEVRLGGGYWAGARLKARKTPNIRGFANAPKRTQSRDGWRTDTFGRDTWRVQRGKVEWFDRAIEADRELYRQAVFEAMEDMAGRILARAR